MYDRVGVKALLITPIVIMSILPLVLLRSYVWIIVGVILWGLVMGFYETVMRAFIADVIETELRSYAYGIYGVLYGVSWTFGNVIIALLYQCNVLRYAPIYVVVVELIALIILVKIATSVQR